MKRTLFPILILSLVLVSCIETPTSKFENLAKETFKESFSELGDDSKDATIKNIKTMFSTDKLCILHAEISGISLKRIEYLFLSQDGKNYEAFNALDDDSVFVNEPTLIKLRKGTIYENLDFAEAILFRASVYINYFGKEVGTNNSDFFIKSPINTGLWELRDFKDEFGDKTSGKYLSLYGKGTWSNSIETDEKLIAVLFVDEERACFRLVKNRRLVDDFSGRIKLKDGEGVIHEIFFRERDKYIEPLWEKEIKEFREIIEKEGTLSVIAEVGGGLLSQKYLYKFKFNLEGFKKAMKYLHSKDSNADQIVESDYDDGGFDIEDSESDSSEPIADEELEKISFNPETESIKEETNTVNSNDEIVSSFDTHPSFEDGDINSWISNHMRYPQEAKEMGQQGKVFVSFVIEKDGSTSGVTIVKSISRELDAEAIRLVKLMKWRPAKLKGENVRSKYNLVVPFYL